MARIPASVLYYGIFKLYILTELNTNDVKLISIDRQMLEKKMFTYGTVNSIFKEIQSYSTNIKIAAPRICFFSNDHEKAFL